MPQGTPPDDPSGSYGGYDRGGGYQQPGGQPMGQGGQPAGSRSGQQATGGGAGYEAPEAARPVPEMDVSRPVLRWVTVPHPDQPAAIGEDDYVLDSFFDARYDTWEVLVLVQPTEEDDEEEAEAEESEDE